ncbi:Pik1p [Saccharomyces cerevisiae x Saccharomyces kudriavzevii VIN7]|uniref:1-phosphatidylinositol 4-kinase n=1 Tax=Saccharomyces cerevisiae x Saccharomyces kudriavzevii (strain VIN7) TaxID=1095631 RepID=H0H032_SACCK|nr:Pik1p [Saccharomyces cerevisiae x Saccharomyces kudriavzevii VIN7]
MHKVSSSKKSFDDTIELKKNEQLLKLINSNEFTLHNCVELLCKHSENVGIHYYLCQKLATFPHNELQFYIPQLVQVLVTMETESMALEDLLLRLRAENPHFALLTFWQLQALLTDLSTDPASYGFQVARRVLNNLQTNLFNTGSSSNKNIRINENVAPALILSSMMMSAIALPQLSEVAKPLVESQGRRQKAFVFKLARSAMKDFTKNMTLKNTLLNKKGSKSKKVSSNGSLVPTSPIDLIDPIKTKEDASYRKSRRNEVKLDFDIVDDIGNQVFEERISSSIKLPKRKPKYLDSSYVHRTYDGRTVNRDGTAMKSEKSVDGKINNTVPLEVRNDENTDIGNNDYETGGETEEDADALNSDQFTSSMPDLHNIRPRLSSASFTSLEGTPKLNRTNSQPLSRQAVKNNKKVNSFLSQEIDLSQLTTTSKIKMLKANYFRCETQFAIALETVSQRLARVPTEARLSALRAELFLLNRDLPAEVDIPTLLPPNKKGKLHKLVTITANEAQVLNSAEKVPYLLLIEYLRDEFDFDPTSETNERLLKKINTNQGSIVFDLNYMNRKENREERIESTTISVDSPSLVYDGNTPYNKISHNDAPSSTSRTNAASAARFRTEVNKEEDLGDMSMVKVKNRTDDEAYRNSLVLQSAANVPILSAGSQDRSPELNFGSNLDEVLIENGMNSKKIHGQTDALADQMRVSAVMLAQLDKSPQQLSESTKQIRAQIISSMKEVQDKFGYHDLEALHGMAGERKLENDLMTGGIDTSYLGEDWATKKDRIRKTSEYGHLENWDLCSVIAKTGDDLRQEAFAYQMIQAMANIWVKEKVDVWVKRMKILITSANTGLVETITNAMSVHSIKKALTKKMIEDAELDDKGGIASLNDHFLRAFGNPNGFKYKRAQDNFACSLAAYSVICYLLQVKDRHNGNIMIDNEGHVSHIDFGFMLSNSPGSVGFEAAPFKLTYEYIELLGGVEGEAFKKFVELTKSSFKALRKYADQIVSMCEIMQKDNMQPCFDAGEQTSVQLRQRFQLELSEKEVDDFVGNFLIGKSLGSLYTRIYDQFQLITQGIYS